MEKKKLLLLIGGIVAAVLLINLSLGLFLITRPVHREPQKIVTVSKAPDVYTYKGEVGKDALTLLKEKFSAEQNSSGLVTTINGRKADDSKKEFWAFYVNGEMASVGPAEYQTKSEDKIEWKIETY